MESIRAISLSTLIGLALAVPAGGQQTVIGRPPGSVFRDCPECPEMVVIPAGDFVMGSSSAEQSWASAHGATPKSVADENPQHRVTVRGFAIGRYDLTRGEYAAFVRETGHPGGDGCGHDGAIWKKLPELNWEHTGFSQTDRDPVVCVNWNDAKAYIAWLNGKVGRGRYRLPNEAEWEYAARAGTATMFWWGDDEALASANAWYRDNSGGHTHPVGQKPANAFRLYDMVGNVWQWTEDCYAEDYADAPTDGRAAETGAPSCRRVDRGGSWFYAPWLLRSAPRERNPADYRDIMLGFRVARDFP
jgi:formylglycine-generating enzyme required for sulfatase activity